MAALLVTGGAGFIGANFVHYWRGRHAGDRLVVLDALTYAGNLANLSGLEEGEAYRFIHGDICDEDLLERLFAEEHIDIVVHFAAETHVDRSIVEPDTFLTTNVGGTHSLLKAARAAWSGRDRGTRFHHVSTDEVYGSLGPDDPPFTENAAYAPNSPYAASKAAADFLVRAYHRTYGLPVTKSNCSNNYGPYQFPEKLVPLMLINALRGRALPVYGDGMNVRDWLFVTDHCRGIELVLEKGRVGETYNVGRSEELPNIELVQRLCDAIDRRVAADPLLSKHFPDSPAARGGSCRSLISFVADRPGHDRRYAIDSSKARTELGFAPIESFASGLDNTIDWYLANESWWRAVQSNTYHDSIRRQDSVCV